MLPYYIYEVAITGVMDNLFLCFCMTVFYFMNKYWLFPILKDIDNKLTIIMEKLRG